MVSLPPARDRVVPAARVTEPVSLMELPPLRLRPPADTVVAPL